MIADLLCLLNIHYCRPYRHTTGTGAHRITRVYDGCACGKHQEFVGVAEVQPLTGRSLPRSNPRAWYRRIRRQG